MLKTILRTVFVASVVAACSKAPVNPYPTDTGLHAGVNESPQQADWSAILKLEDQAKAIVKVSGCATSECRAAAVGSRACGGPRYYLPYCAKTTDSVALYGKLDEVAKAEQAYNRKYKIVSTCILLMPPQVDAVGGSCVAK
ncbi:MAG: hypothetical protein ABR582_12675 [Gemmatimonadaceae bacterium]